MSARLLLDEHISPDVAEQLRARGIDAVAVSDRPELRGRADGDVLGAAAAEDRAVVTRNLRDFLPLDSQWASQGRRHAGIVCVRYSKFPEDSSFIGRLTEALDQWVKEDPHVQGTYTFPPRSA